MKLPKINSQVLQKKTKTAGSIQMTMNPCLIGGSSITSNITLMVFTGTYPKYSVEGYLIAVTGTKN